MTKKKSVRKLPETEDEAKLAWCEAIDDEDAQLRVKQFNDYCSERMGAVIRQLTGLSETKIMKLKMIKDTTLKLNLLNRFDSTKDKTNLVSVAKEFTLLRSIRKRTPATEKTIRTKPTNIQLYLNLLLSTAGVLKTRRNIHFNVSRDVPILVCKVDGCKLYASASYPYCLRHLTQEMQLVVRNSMIPGAGLGLFTTVDLKEGQQVYFHDVSDLILTKQEVDRLYGDFEAPYTWAHEDQLCFDDFFQRTFIGCANGNVTKEQQNIENTLTVKDGKVFSECFAIKDIFAGEELITNYGSNYNFEKFSSYLV